MSALTSPAASPIAPPAKAAAPSVLAPGVPSLAAFIDLMIGKIASPVAKAATGDADRQDDAETGNSLPDKGKHLDPSLAWLFGAQPLDAPRPLTATLLPLTPASLAPTALPADEPIAPVIPSEIPTPAAKAKTENAVEQPQPIAFTLPSAHAPIVNAPPAVMPPSVAVALPALFALAPYRAEREDDAARAGPIAATLAPSADTIASIAPTGDAQRPTLDLGRQDWPQKMIDHIEALRDNANANDTSIRLKPEALGRVDVSLKTHTDGAISVRFTAEQPTTRTLLVDAAPQLAAAAEARGIRLSGTSVDLGGQGDQRPRPEIERPQDSSNHLAASTGDDSPAVDDGRIA